MPANIEIKARVDDFAALEQLAEKLSGAAPTVIQQEDTFFHAPHGRLKLRVFENGHGELIQYHRPDLAGPKHSQYTIVPTARPDALKSALAAALGILGIVRKTRLLHLIGQTRLHLDDVENLGHFMEIEVVMQSGQSPENGERIARDLMQKLNVKTKDLIQGAYLDLLLAEKW